MRRTIWKYQFEVQDTVVLQLPKNSEILSVQPVGNRLTLWALVYPDNAVEDRTIQYVPTGVDMPEEPKFMYNYLGTCQFFSGSFIGHFFERTSI